DRAGVDLDDGARLDRAVAGNAVDDFAVDGDARAGRERLRALAVSAAAEVALERRNRARVADVALGQGVEVAGGDAGLQLGFDEREDLRDDASRPAHLVDLASGLPRDHRSSATAQPRASRRSVVTSSIACSPL